jgi:restriction system protein
MPIPDFQTAMLPVLQAFADGASNVAAVLPLLKERFSITDEEAEETLPSGRITKLQSRAHWARTYLSKAGLLKSPSRNQHVITEAGRKLLKSGVTRIDMQTLEQFPSYLEWREKERGPIETQDHAPSLDAPEASVQTPDERIEKDFQLIESALVEELLAAMTTMHPTKFEQLIVDLLIAMGYGGGDQTMGERIGKSGDGGIDGIINEDALGLDAVYVQAKRYASETKVGRPALQAFVDSLTGEGANKGVFVTTSDFSKDAREYLNKVQHRIVLINGHQLAKLMIQHEVGVRARRSYVIRSVDEDYFSDQSAV